jgi:benzylsuccinate CoA-transferase BbsF subunit
LSDSTGALTGVRILSFGAFVAGNTVNMLLAELGAEVVKIESRARPEILRTFSYLVGPPAHEPSGVPQTPMYAGLARSTFGLSLEMTTPQGRAVFQRLAAVSHVVIENFGMHVMAGWGCSFEELTAVNPGIVVCSLSGYGRTGPRAPYRAYASNISNFIGLTALTGYAHGTHTDYITAEHGALAVLAALRQAGRTGRGVKLDVAQIEASAAVIAPVLLEPLVNGCDVPACGNEVPGALLSGTFPSAMANKPVALELEDLDDWSVLCAFLDRADLAAPSIEEATSKRELLRDAFASWSAQQSPFTAMHLLQREGLAAGAVYNNEDVARDPQLRDRHAVVEITHPDLGVIEGPESPHRLSRTPGRLRWAAPRLGEHTAQVLSEWLGMSHEEVDTLETAGAVFQAPPANLWPAGVRVTR